MLNNSDFLFARWPLCHQGSDNSVSFAVLLYYYLRKSYSALFSRHSWDFATGQHQWEMPEKKWGAKSTFCQLLHKIRRQPKFAGNVNNSTSRRSGATFALYSLQICAVNDCLFIVITSAQKVIFSSALVYLFVSWITQKLLNRYSQKSVERWRVGRGRDH